MAIALGRRLKIRGMAYVAGEPIPYFWPMRSFIHHNPLHGLEHLPFTEAVETGARLFGAKGFLARREYQRLLAAGKVDRRELAAQVDTFLKGRTQPNGIDLRRWLMVLLTELSGSISPPAFLAEAPDVEAVLKGRRPTAPPPALERIETYLRAALLAPRPLYDAVDAVCGTDLGVELDEAVIRCCLEFFDEGQSAWSMPGRERGFFAAWRDLARLGRRVPTRTDAMLEILDQEETPEAVIVRIMEALGVDEDDWQEHFTRELVRLHGWAGFIRWRSNAKHYYWAQRYPGDLVDLLAIRLAVAFSLLTRTRRKGIPATETELREAIERSPCELYLRYELNGGTVLPELAGRVERTLAGGHAGRIEALFPEYMGSKRLHEAGRQADRLRELAGRVGDLQALRQASVEELQILIGVLQDFERSEGMIWLRAMESQAMERMVAGMSLDPPPAREKRPFAQALFCIDTRSERIRRHLEGVGDYQTYGIAGFFGVPISFIELGKGSETQLCPVLLTPKNLVLEVAPSPNGDPTSVAALEKALHELKGAVLTPYFTVEAIGWLFGLDMVGKTIMPRQYSRWRNRLHEAKPHTRLMVDKLSREQADSVVRAVHRAVIVKAVELEFGLEVEEIKDHLVRELREAAMGNREDAPLLRDAMALDEAAEQAFIGRLRDVYRINPASTHLKMERLARIGFSLDEQVMFVSQALRSIGLTRDFSRFVLLVGHGSRSENNPYESALDCGACGGNHGLINACVLAQMASKPEVRRRLRGQGIDIADDVWFVPALHNTTTDQLELFELDRIPPAHVVYLDRLHKGLAAAARLCTQERIPTLQDGADSYDPRTAFKRAQRNAVDWSQVRPEWGLAGNAYFVIGRRALTQSMMLEGRAFLHSYDYRLDGKRRLLENILAGPLVVGQWINMEHYFSTVDNERYGSGSKVYHNVAGRFGVMTGNLSDLRTGLPAQTVLKDGHPYHEPVRLITVIEAPFEHARQATESVVPVKHLIRNGWIRLLILDPEQGTVNIYEEGRWVRRRLSATRQQAVEKETTAQ